MDKETSLKYLWDEYDVDSHHDDPITDVQSALITLDKEINNSELYNAAVQKEADERLSEYDTKRMLNDWIQRGG